MTSYIDLLIVRVRLRFVYYIALIVATPLLQPFIVLFAFLQFAHLAHSLPLDFVFVCNWVELGYAF